MESIGTFEAKNRLSELLDRVQKGEEITITRNGKPVARLVAPVNDDERKNRAREAAARIREMRKGVMLGGLSVKDLIDEGRR